MQRVSLKHSPGNSSLCNCCFKKTQHPEFYLSSDKRKKFDCRSCLRQQDKLQSKDKAVSLLCNKCLKGQKAKPAFPIENILQTPNMITDAGKCSSSHPSLIEFLDEKPIDYTSIISDVKTNLHTEQNEPI